MTLNDSKTRKYAVILLAFAAFIVIDTAITTQWQYQNDIELTEYELNDGNLTIHVRTESKKGIQNIKTWQEDEKLYCQFYTSVITDKNAKQNTQFEIPIDETMTKIYFSRGNRNPVMVLAKSEDGTLWKYTTKNATLNPYKNGKKYND